MTGVVATDHELIISSADVRRPFSTFSLGVKSVRLVPTGSNPKRDTVVIVQSRQSTRLDILPLYFLRPLSCLPPHPLLPPSFLPFRHAACFLLFLLLSPPLLLLAPDAAFSDEMLRKSEANQIS